LETLRPGSRIAVGSSPWLDPEAATQVQVRSFPEVPAWAQLPKRSPFERMDRQGLMGLPGLTWNKSGEPRFDLSPEGITTALQRLKMEGRKGELEGAALRPEEGAGFFALRKEVEKPFFKGALAFKGQVAGPVTLGICLKTGDGKPLLSSPKSMDLLVEYLVLHCRWQAKELGKFGSPVVIFLDEPYLGGKFDPRTYGLDAPLVHSWFTRILGPLQEEGVLTGIHCCGEGPWDRLMESEVEILHFDAFRHGKQVLASPDPFAAFIRKGGMVAWGLVPSAMTRGTFPDPADLFHRWEDMAQALVGAGLPLSRVVEASLFSTSCGLGESTMSVAAEAGQCLASLVSLWRTHAAGS